jgi:hypothetical protein
MQVSQEDFETLEKLEESMWITGSRGDKAFMERTLSPDFFEFGCSGRTYTRVEILAQPIQKIKAKLPLKDVRITPLAHDVVLVTYVSQVMGASLQICNRASIWTRTPTGWQLRFHQGTPVPR